MKRSSFLPKLLSRYRSWRWARRTQAMSKGTQLAMEIGNRYAAANPPSSGLIKAVRLAMEHDRKLKKSLDLATQ